MNEKDSDVMESKWFLLGVIDGVLRGIDKDIKKLKEINYFSVILLKREKEKWLEEREKIINQVRGRREIEHIS